MDTGWRRALALSMDRQKGLSMPMGHPLPTLLPCRHSHPLPITSSSATTPGKDGSEKRSQSPSLRSKVAGAGEGEQANETTGCA